MITFDFFECNKDKLLTSFCQYFSLNYLTTKEYFERANRETIDEETVIKELGLNLNNFESSKVSMIVKHMTIINIEDTQYPLNISMGSCEVCLKGNDKICSKYFGCEFKKKLYHLALKLYKYKGTTEFFISGTLKDMKRYSTIDRYPEILETLAQLIGEQKSKSYPDYSICHEWIKEHPLCIVIEFVVKLSEIETFNPISSNDWFNAYESCLDFCDYSYDDFINNNIPKKIFDNLYIIRLFNSFYFWGNSENYGSLLEDQIVSPENIVSIIEV